MIDLTLHLVDVKKHRDSVETLRMIPLIFNKIFNKSDYDKGDTTVFGGQELYEKRRKLLFVDKRT